MIAFFIPIVRAAENGTGAEDLTIQGVINIFNGLACWGFSVALSLATIFLIVSGIRWMAAGDNSEKVTSAKKNFFWVLIGILVILVVAVIINSVAVFLGAQPLTVFRC